MGPHLNWRLDKSSCCHCMCAYSQSTHKVIVCIPFPKGSKGSLLLGRPGCVLIGMVVHIPAHSDRPTDLTNHPANENASINPDQARWRFLIILTLVPTLPLHSRPAVCGVIDVVCQWGCWTVNPCCSSTKRHRSSTTRSGSHCAFDLVILTMALVVIDVPLTLCGD